MTEYNIDELYLSPVYGKISAGEPNWAEQNIEGRIPIDFKMFGIDSPEECFYLKVDGESMNKVVKNGSYALIQKQDVVEDGEIAVVLVNGFDATLKKFKKQGDLVILEPMSDDTSICTMLYYADVKIELMGHSSADMVYNIYTHLNEERENATELLNSYVVKCVVKN